MGAEPVASSLFRLLRGNFARSPFDAPALGARVAQLSVHGLRQQQRLQVLAGVGLAEPPKHLWLVAGLYPAFHTSTLAPAVNRS